LLPRAHSLCRSVLDYYSKAAPEMQAFFSIFLRFFQKKFISNASARKKLAKGERPAGVERGAAKGCSVLEYRRRIVIYM